MSEILSKLEAMPTGYRFAVSDKVQFLASSEVHEIFQPTQALVFDKEYILRAEITVGFRANTASFKHAQESARHQVANLIYGDVVSKINSLKYLVVNGDKNDALKLIDEILDDMR